MAKIAVVIWKLSNILLIARFTPLSKYHAYVLVIGPKSAGRLSLLLSVPKRSFIGKTKNQILLKKHVL